MERKIVVIKNSGCTLYPHNTIHQIKVDEKGRYRTMGEGVDFIPVKWCKEIELDLHETCYDGVGKLHLNKESIFGKKSIFGGVSLNEFFKMGYYVQSKKKSDFFTVEEYDEFEAYVKENNLDILK